MLALARGLARKIHSNQRDVIFPRPGFPFPGPTRQFGQRRAEQPSGREMGLRFQELEKAHSAKLFLGAVLCFEHAVRVEQAAIPGPEGKLQRSVGRVFRETEQQAVARSEEHTSELQSLTNLVCRLLLEKKKKKKMIIKDE